MDETVNTKLEPNPEKLLALVNDIVTLGWPDRDDDQADYLLRLGFHQGEGQEGFHKGYGYSPGPDSAAVLGGELRSAGLAVTDASWSSYKGELLSIGFFVYDGRDSHDTSAVLGYHSIYSQLLSRYGQPADATVRPYDSPSIRRGVLVLESRRNGY